MAEVQQKHQFANALEAWFGLTLPVMLARNDGSFALVQGERVLQTSTSPVDWSGIRSLELAADSVALTSVTKPDAPPALWDQIILTQIQTLSPIDSAELVWGWRQGAPDSDTVEVAVTTRKRVAEQMKAALPWQPDEVWAPVKQGYVVLRGFAEEGRRQKERVRQRVAVVVMVFLLCCLMLGSLMPLMAQRSQLQQASAALTEIRAAAAPVLHLRERSLLLSAELDYVVARKTLSNQSLSILEKVTTSLPDTAYLNRLEVERDKVSASGHARDAAALIDALGHDPAFGQLRTRGSITRDRDGRDAFNIEFEFKHVRGGAHD